MHSTTVTAHTIVLSWVSGRSGGSTQTFQIHYREESAASFTIITDIIDPGVGNRSSYTISALKEQTKYVFMMVSVNGFEKENNMAESSLIAIKTLG